MKADFATIGLCCSVVVLWGLWGFFGKIALERGMPPMLIFVAEACTGFVIALGFAASRVAVAPASMTWSVYGLLSGAVMAFGLLAYYLALHRGSVSLVVVATSTYPVVTVLMSMLVLNEKLTMLNYFGVALIIAGLGLVLGVGAP